MDARIAKERPATSTEIGKYVTCELTYQWYEELMTSEWREIWSEPIRFFELFHEMYALIIGLRENPIHAFHTLKERLTALSSEEQCFIYTSLSQKLERDFNTLFVLGNEKLKLCHTLIEKEIYDRWPLEEVEEDNDDRFKWANIKQELSLLNEPACQVSYLINISAEYRQQLICSGQTSTGISEMCEIEIDRIKRQQELEAMKAPYSGNIYLSQEKGKKINFIRVLNSLYELRYFNNDKGQIPSKETVMVTIGKALGVDLSSYDSDLSQAFNSGNCDRNTAIFKQMTEITENQIETRNVTKKQY